MTHIVPVEVSPIDRVEREYTASVILAQGSSGTVGTLTFAVVPTGGDVSSETEWKTFPVTDDAVVVTYAAPQATSETSDLKIPRLGCDAYVKEVRGSLVKAILVDRFKVT